MSESKHQFYVIGAGLSRTGTLSLKVALEKLFPGNCMHFLTVIQGNLQEQLDEVFVKAKCTDASFKNYFKKHNIVAAVDVPFIFQYKRAMRVFPDAKIVLTVREPSAWAKSMEQTVFRLSRRKSTFERFLAYVVHTLIPSTFRLDQVMNNDPVLKSALDSIEKEEGENFFNDWIEDVKENVPSEKLLIFNVKEGWKPLCNFLNLPIPDEPFPRVNDTKEFQKRQRFYRNLVAGGLCGGVVVSCLVSYGIAVFLGYDINTRFQSWFLSFSAK